MNNARFAQRLLVRAPRCTCRQLGLPMFTHTALARLAFTNHTTKQRFNTSATTLGAPTESKPATSTQFTVTEDEYHRLSDQTMDELVTFLEDLGDAIEMDDFDVEYSQGVLTLSVGEAGTYVINKQPPNRQIWISSPVSGPERFDFSAEGGVWVCRKTKSTLGKLLGQELDEILGRSDLAKLMPIK